MFTRWTLFVPDHSWIGLGRARDPHASSPQSPSSVRWRWLSLPALLHVGGYAALIVFFRWIDVYHAHFATSGPLVVLYNLCRVAFIFYLFWIVHAAGSLALGLLGCERPAGTGILEWLAVGFFAGAGVWHLGMLCLGFLSLYTPLVAVLLTLPLVVLSTSHVRCAWSELAIRLAPLQPGSLPSHAISIEAVVAKCLTAALGASLLMLLLVKGLYPAGGHDYFLHYFPYLQSVIARGNLWPNEVWYHFYYSKGAGLYFLGMLLTDPLAPQLVTFCLVAVASIALFQLLSRLAPETWWPHVGVILWLALYIHTPGQGEYRLNGGWGDFEKLHELNAALVAAVIWLIANALARGERVWWVAAACAIVAAVIINVTISIYFGAVFATLSAWLLFRRRWRLSRNCLLLTVTAGLALLSLLGINYAVTGLINDQGILTLWKYADVEKLYQLGTLPWVIYLHQGTTGMLANSMPFGMPLVDLLINSLRLDLLYPLVGGGVLLFALALLVRRAVVRDPVLLAFLLISILACIVLTSTAGRAQPISFFRYASFTCIVLIAFGACCWGNLPSRYFGRRQALGLVLPALVLWATWHGAAKSYQPGAFSAVASQAWQIARGAYSIDQAPRANCQACDATAENAPGW